MKKITKSVWAFIKKSFANIKKKISNAHRLEDKYQDLAPIDSISNGKEYLKVLHWAIKNKRIKNIAITGPYGSGKSSIINSYLRHHPIIKAQHLRVSMATFVENIFEGDNVIQSKIDLKPEQIEEGILKQLFYKVSHNKIPQSRYRKLFKISFLYIFIVLVLLILITGFFWFVFSPDSLNSTIELIAIAGAKFDISKTKSLIIFFLVIVAIALLLSYIVRLLYSRLRVNEIKVKDTTISKEQKDDGSIFNKNMDEIIYFFEETKYRIVFFEDLDRLDSSKIFVQLRELNTLLNNCDTIKRPIVFVYAVKDDIFTEEDRTKFFEFIIPVIPIINSTNSGEIMIDLFNANNAKPFAHSISHDYILDISPYISDMRVLQNIHNEFLLYKRTLRTAQQLELSDELMLSLIIFKNLYPKDFADLQMEKGTVKKAFDDKQDYIMNEQTRLQDAIDAAANLIENAQNEICESIKELKTAMLSAIVDWSGFATSVRRSNYSEITASQIMDNSFDFTKLISGDSWTVNRREWRSTSSSSISVSNFTEICREYYERYKKLKLFEEKTLSSLQEEIENNRRKKVQISRWSIKKLIEEDGDYFFSEEVRRNKLLIFMLRKGYIDEEYVNYVNYFKGNTMTTADKNFILSIKNHEAKPFDYSITKVRQVVQGLQLHEFEQKESLNYEVLEYLLSTSDHSEKLLEMIKQLSDGSDLSWRFIDEFIMRTSKVDKFILLLSRCWKLMWKTIHNNILLTYDRKAYYLSLLCSFSDIDTLISQNGEERLITKFFEEHDDILQKLSNVDPEKMVSIVCKLEIVFNKLNITGVDSDVLEFIFENRFYTINPDMLYNVVAYKDASLCNQLRAKNYTTIIKLGYIPLTEYIHENLPFYIDSIVLDGSNRHENIEQIIELIRQSIDNVDRCKKIIQHEDFCLSNISQCCSELFDEWRNELRSVWNALLDFGKIEISWINIQKYWELFGLSKELCEYISTHSKKLIVKESECLSEDFKKDFIQSDIKPPVFVELLKHMQLPEFDIPLANIHEENVGVMTKQHFFDFSTERYEELDKSYPALCTGFITENLTEFLDAMAVISIKGEVFESLTLNPQIDNEFKQRLINNYGSILMTKLVAEHIVSEKIAITKDGFDAAWEALDINGKTRLMFECLSVLQAEDFENCFSVIGNIYQELSDRSKRRKVTIPDSEEHRNLANRLLQVEYITSFDLVEAKEYSSSLRKMIDQPVVMLRIKADK